MPTYESTFCQLVTESGASSWDFRTLSLSRFQALGARLAEILVEDGIFNSPDQASKHYVPTPAFRSYLLS